MENKVKDKISIIIPIYNAEEYLRKCLDSVMNQSYTNLEIICVDDGSTDHSRNIIEEYKQRDERVCAIFKENGGQNSARKLGLEYAVGSRVMFVDADDCIDADMCEKLLECCRTYHVNVAGCGIKKEEANGTARNISLYKNGEMIGKEAALNLIDIQSFYRANICTSLYGYLFDIELVKEVMCDFDERITYSEDVVCMFLILWDAARVYILDEYLYTIIAHASSVTHNHDKRYYDSQRILYRYGQREFKKRNMPPEMYVSLEQLIIRDLLIAGYEEAFGHLEELFPFHGVQKGAQVAVYGAGAVGIEIVRYIRRTGDYALICWVDESYQYIGNHTECPSVLTRYQYDFVIVAVSHENVAKSIEGSLLRMNIPKHKIKIMQMDRISYRFLPTDFFGGDF